MTAPGNMTLYFLNIRGGQDCATAKREKEAIINPDTLSARSKLASELTDHTELSAIKTKRLAKSGRSPRTGIFSLGQDLKINLCARKNITPIAGTNKAKGKGDKILPIKGKKRNAIKLVQNRFCVRDSKASDMPRRYDRDQAKSLEKLF